MTAESAWQPQRLLCVTGTNGKTTTTSMIAAIVAAAGEPAARSTTIGAWVNDRAIDAPPESRLAPFIEAAARANVRAIALEVVSMALAMGFASRYPPDVAVFTNLMEDHYQLHGSREAYLSAKTKLFKNLRSDGTAVLNACDPVSIEMANAAPASTRALAYAVGAAVAENAALPVVLAARSVEATRDGLQLTLEPGALADALGGALRLSVTGAHNANNALAAAVAGHAAGYSPVAIKQGLAEFSGVPGRFQIVSARPLVVVDFAHTPDALRTVLTAARELAGRGRLTCVFGCGGERSHDRRGPLGRVAGALADHVIVTSDNPRNEDPAAIAAAIERGLRESLPKSRWRRELDRGLAIESAIRAARPDDVVLIAGKGHETTQEARGYELPWSDVEVARTALARASSLEETPRPAP